MATWEERGYLRGIPSEGFSRAVILVRSIASFQFHVQLGHYSLSLANFYPVDLFAPRNSRWLGDTIPDNTNLLRSLHDSGYQHSLSLSPDPVIFLSNYPTFGNVYRSESLVPNVLFFGPVARRFYKASQRDRKQISGGRSHRANHCFGGNCAMKCLFSEWRV